jgi:hypothetical protein
MPMKWNKLDLPWPEVHSVYLDDGPAEAIEFEVLGVHFKVAPTEHRGCDTGRVRYYVECLDCKEVLHEATTGPRPNIENHMEGAHGWVHYERCSTN